MTDLSLFRVYEPHELGKDGYPVVWHSGLIPVEDLDDGEYIADYDTRISWAPFDPDVHAAVEGMRVGVKHIVRMLAGHRCVRCGHPFVVGKSGVMEGPQAEAKAFAAEIGVSVEVLDSALELFDDPIQDEALLDKAPRTNWSPCDELCTHGGPYRYCDPNGEWQHADADDQVNTAGQVLRLVPSSEVQAAWRILTVHHLNGVKHDLRWHNLAALCQRDHLQIQRQVVMEQMWPFEHDEWFKPYAAGFYAYKYEGREVTRGEAMERMDGLLAYERLA